VLVEGESESLILPYFFDVLKFDYLAKGITIVRCGGKNELDRFYRLYSEFGIPCYIIFDGDKQHIGTSEEKATIKKNKALLRLFGEISDFPDGKVKEGYLGYDTTFEQSLIYGSTQKGLKLYKLIRERVLNIEQIPNWVPELVGMLDALTNSVTSSKLLKEVSALQ
ncbi:MAG: ATP-dependent endonuclease, partial [Bacteroidota bacterium]|nr:ATP-dependent endonuclease [Bacteroidota bacterium]